MWQSAIFEVSHSENRGKSSLNGNDEIVSGKLELSKIDISCLARYKGISYMRTSICMFQGCNENATWTGVLA